MRHKPTTILPTGPGTIFGMEVVYESTPYGWYCSNQSTGICKKPETHRLGGRHRGTDFT
jgi:hypothetical protein